MKTKTIKLSDKQKEIIRLMREGGILNKSYTNEKYWLDDLNGYVSLFDGRIINGLEVRGLVYNSTYRFYKLTELGKTIPI